MIANLLRRAVRRFSVRRGVSHDKSLHVGWGSVVWAPRSLVIGRDVYIGKHVTIEVDGTIGDGVLIANGVGIVGRRDHDMSAQGQIVARAPWVGDEPERLSLPIHVSSDVWIGYNATLLSGITVGPSAVIAAGSVVLRDVPENCIVAGNPAEPVRSRFTMKDYEAHWRQLEGLGYRRSYQDGS